MDDRLEDLRSLQVFRDLDERELLDLRDMFRPVVRSRGERLLTQNTPVEAAYFLTHGEVEVIHALPGGGETLVATLGAGTMVGETALLEGGTSTATVRVREELRGYEVDCGYFQAAISQLHPSAFKIVRRLIRILAERRRNLYSRILELKTSGGHLSYLPDSVLSAEGVAVRGECTFDYEAFLPILPFFRHFTRDEIDRLASETTVIEAQRGYVLCEEGWSRSACFVVVRGALEAGVARGGHWYPLALVAPGHLCGEQAFLNGGRHGATIRVRETAVLLEIGPDLFDFLFHSESPISLKFQRAINEEQLYTLRRADNRLAQLISTRQINERHQG